MIATPTWLAEPALQQFLTVTKNAGGEARIIGGAVRDHLIPPPSGGRLGGGLPTGDLDLASTLLPEKTMEMAAQLGFKSIPTGIAHGTVTIVLPNRVIEVTTLRRDVETDGRHATVAYTDNWQEDAARRDFTINAMSMDAEGKIYDYFNGQKDLASHRIVFIGDAATRIQEDALRILRFFRFLASHGKPPADAQALAAITKLTAMIDTLSGERIAAEMKKLLTVENPAFTLRLMEETGTAAHVFLHSITPARMIRLHMLENQSDYQTSVWARVALLIDATPADAKSIAERWKLSRHEAQQLALLATLPAFDAASPRHTHTRLLRLHGAPTYLDWLLTQAASQQGIDVTKYVALANDFKPPTFPITAADLIARGMKEGKALGDTLSALEKRWEESDYSLTKPELLATLSS